jgi:mRNA interferase HigB
LLYSGSFLIKDNSLRIISKKKIRIYSQKNKQAELPLLEWYLKMLAATPKNLTELRKIFNSVDYAYGYTIFNIGGNNYRLISAMHYNTRLCYIRTIWSHAEYSKLENQTKLRRGLL